MKLARRPHQSVPLGEVVVAVGAQDQEAVCAPVRRYVNEQVQTGWIGPLQVVDDEQRSALGGDCAQELTDGLEETKPRLLCGKRIARRKVAETLAELRQDGHERGGNRSGLRHQAVQRS